MLRRQVIEREHPSLAVAITVLLAEEWEAHARAGILARPDWSSAHCDECGAYLLCFAVGHATRGIAVRTLPIAERHFRDDREWALALCHAAIRRFLAEAAAGVPALFEDDPT